MQDGIRKIPS